MKRREFLQSSALAATAMAWGAPALAETSPANTPPGATPRAEIRRFRDLGKTGIRMSDISFGAGSVPSGSLILRAIDRGINYFDTAPDYGPSEDHFGEAMKRIKDREKIKIASKFCHPIPYQEGKSHLGLGTTVAEYIAAVDNSLKRMGTGYLDVVFVHAIGERNDLEQERRRMLDENMLTAVDRLKKEGKIRHLAVSSHGPHGMESLMLEAVNSGHFDLVMMAFNFMKFPRIPEIMRLARQKGVGVIAMKTLAGARESGAKLEAGQFEQAALKWVLNHEEVSGLVVTFKSVQDLDLFLPASGQTMTAGDRTILEHYAALHGDQYCRTGCGECAGVCEQKVDIATILRYQMYFQNYGDEKRAMESYAALDGSARPCLECTNRACANACPHGLPIASRLVAAHKTLTLSFMA
ncbi:MAG: aldo/keto reductase [Magnetococcales bacterium]|nr:aldo/keto reductase [Magnetococcales bacterium]